MTKFTHLLVPIDFEPSSQRALDTAVDLATMFDARLTVVHAWDIPANAYPGMLALSPEIWQSLADAAEQALTNAVARVRERLPRAEALLRRGPPAFEILGAIEQVRADLVVMGTHGRHGVGRFLLGSVAEKVVRGSPVAVLTVRGAAQAS
jgi:nucleotide-binding universal stress UspA family protein